MLVLARGLALLAAALCVARWAHAVEPVESATPATGASAEAGKEPEPEGGFFSRFIDPVDGRLDMTAGGESGTSGFVPLIIPGNDPALGAGLLAAMVYFHPSKLTPEQAAENPPTMTGGGVAATDNDSWVVAGLHSAVWSGGRVRYLAVLGEASLNLDYYGSEKVDLSENPLHFNLEGTLLVQQAQFRLGDSRLFAGMRYMFFATDIGFDLSPPVPEFGRTQDAGLSLLLDYDARDNTFTPNKGRSTSLAVSYFAESLGGDFDYAKVQASDFEYWQMFKQRMTFGLRLEYSYADDGAPFYSQPWVSLRGIPLLRYLGHHVVTAEVEPRWKIDERWSVLGFAGVGRAADEFDELSGATRAYSYGGGFRYLLSRKLGLAGGFDLARGPEETVLYLTFGNAWGM